MVANQQNNLCDRMTAAFHEVAHTCLSPLDCKPKKPWISISTLQLVKDRVVARQQGDAVAEKQLTAAIKANLLKHGDWREIRKLKKTFCPKQGRELNSEGGVVDSNARAEALAEFFAEKQWCPRNITPPNFQDTSWTTLEVDHGDITGEEVIAAAKLLRRRKACGSDDLPPEFWKAICNTSSPACRWAVLLCNKIWRHADVPDAWHLAVVTAVFKKGDASKCDNYRPILLLAFGYKIFASVLLHWLRAAGAEARIWATISAALCKQFTPIASFRLEIQVQHRL